MPRLNFTKRAIEAISPPESGQVLYRDAGLRGFGLRVGSRSKVFFVEGRRRRTHTSQAQQKSAYLTALSD
jgi:hypothetical protein